MSIRVGINGFGRIGRLVMRAAQSNPNISIVTSVWKSNFGRLTPSTRRCLSQVGVNDPFIPVDYMRYMLKYDTVHGRFPNTVEVAGDSIAVGGDKVKVFGERDPSRAVWKSTSELGYFHAIEQTQLRMAWARNLISPQVEHRLVLLRRRLCD
jgi:glyceraldehyde 3-phosphate dehydrogenase